ncbi:MAG TPA: flagellar export chaperone FlgN [Humidesulfovibrio sp.]|uniref:flagellar export chaperone FlgN n=1 Tax=Humidesulfovibrio sp. TaxID=2910988 RepID=UPI002B61152E|nr:flagellar export chaperone FlgN [Humidesulfovibrio sp.]HWR04754.1 flagellar export chaperone FlgN [Humidesulfovibrio sp.]
MIQSIQENLTRQIRALELLSSLLEEEFADLRDRKPQDVSILELSIQELMRQIAGERKSLRSLIETTYPGKQRVSEVAQSLAPEVAQALSGQLAVLDRAEQTCAIQADMNRQLAMGLYDQSLNLLKQLHQAIEPGKSDMYSRRGRFARSAQPQVSMFRGGV